jgi:hypothetical protein
LQAILERDRIIDSRNNEVSQVYDLKAYVTVNQLVSISLESWIGKNSWQQAHGYGDAIKTALLSEVNAILEARDRDRRDREQKAKLETAKLSGSNVELPHKLGGIQNYLS